MTKQERQERFEKFVKELEKISIKYKIVIYAIGGVIMEDDIDMIEYSKDYTSGDLIPVYVRRSNEEVRA